MTETDAAPSARRARTRERLVMAALEVFAEHGLAAASVEQVAEHAGFTRGAFYSNFSSKEELFLALMSRGRELWLEAVTTRVDEMLPAGTTADVAEREIGELITAVLGGPFDHRRWSLVQNEFRMLAMRDPELARAFLDDRAQFESTLVPLVDDALRRARRRFTIDTLSAVRIAWAVYVDAEGTAALLGETEEQSLVRVRAALSELLTAFTVPA